MKFTYPNIQQRKITPEMDISLKNMLSLNIQESADLKC